MGRNIRPNYYVGPTFDAEVNWMKIWIKDRIAWIDRQYPVLPKLSEKPGAVAAGTKLKLSGGAGEIYYTLDGSDPRASGGASSKQAQKYGAPIVLDREIKFTARLRRGNVWSGPVSATYTLAKP